MTVLFPCSSPGTLKTPCGTLPRYCTVGGGFVLGGEGLFLRSRHTHMHPFSSSSIEFCLQLPLLKMTKAASKNCLSPPPSARYIEHRFPLHSQLIEALIIVRAKIVADVSYSFNVRSCRLSCTIAFGTSCSVEIDEKTSISTKLYIIRLWPDISPQSMI